MEEPRRSVCACEAVSVKTIRDLRAASTPVNNDAQSARRCLREQFCCSGCQEQVSRIVLTVRLPVSAGAVRTSSVFLTRVHLCGDVKGSQK